MLNLRLNFDPLRGDGFGWFDDDDYVSVNAVCRDDPFVLLSWGEEVFTLSDSRIPAMVVTSGLLTTIGAKRIEKQRSQACSTNDEANEALSRAAHSNVPTAACSGTLLALRDRMLATEAYVDRTDTREPVCASLANATVVPVTV